jgi:colanic acid/amylovoran biosynthesis glycosyltransferase
VAVPALKAIHSVVVPRLRWDVDPGRYVDWVAAILERRRARILHAYFGPLAWRMLEVKRRLGLPLVVSFLGDDVGPQIGSWWWWLVQTGTEKPDWSARIRDVFAGADLCLVEGPYLRQRLIDLGCPPEKVATQRIALPLDDLPAPRSKPSRDDGVCVILFAARFCEQKGALYALDAVARLWANRRDIEFRLIGDDTLTDGSYASRVYASIRAHRLRGCVRMLGFLNRADYLRELANADIFLQPSITDDEGYSEGGAPTTILEAQALGVPVVSTLHCDIPNVTIDGETALLVPERDDAALATALVTLIDDPELRTRMGRAGRRFIEERHDIVREAVLLEERYAALLDEPNS